MKFIHTSDWHIDNRFSRFTDEKKIKILKESRWHAIENLFEYARKNNIKLFLIAGDQFEDGFSANPDDLIKLLKLIKKYNDITFIMITGNHDPYSEGSVYKKVSEDTYPSNLKFIKDKETIELQDLNCKIFAASLLTKNGRINPLNWIDDNNEDFIRIGIAHGSIMIPEKYNPDDFPIETEFAINKKLDYLALGHYHTFLKYNERTFYSGTIEQMQSHDTSYALEVDLTKNSPPSIKKIEGLNRYSWIRKEYTVNDNNFSSIVKELEQFNEYTVLELELNGYLSMENYNKLIEKIKTLNVFEYFFIDNIQINPSKEEIESLNITGYLKDILEEIKNDSLWDISSFFKKNKQEAEKYGIYETQLKQDILLKIYGFFKNKENR
ncbi:MAG TPA: metallophosphoesterase [Spirochaetota bacterium]|nr:metallophosphoesterase [Spirochaetota bacterium]HOL56038.1 metallophosphoesterase [Spirochaetota bacterium]HPP03480.1 metallophosphoesterase [Spirochaetota bacterium]